MWMFERQLSQGLLLRLGQFNGTFHRQAGHQNHIACQTPYFEIRLLVALIPNYEKSPAENSDRAHGSVKLACISAAC
jgi:hypothetical protein